MEFHIPTDYERLPEFRLLEDIVRRNVPANAALTPSILATFYFFRLFVDLAYLAQQGNKLGVLSAESSPLYITSVGGDPGIIAMLEKSKVLTVQGQDHFCDRFAKLNEHLASDYKPGHMRAAERSAISRAKNQIAQDAMKQQMLLPSELFRDRENKDVSAVVQQNAMRIIGTLDKVLNRPQRPTSHYGDGIIVDAIEVARKYTPEQMQDFYYWLLDHRDKAIVPKTTEQLLPMVDDLMRQMRP